MIEHQRFAVVTGGGSGIGRHAALALAKQNFRVAVLGRRLKPLEVTTSMADAGQIWPLVGDISKPQDVEKAFQEIAREFGRLDFLFNNAGIGAPLVSIDQLSYEDWQACIDTNLTGSFLCAKFAFRMMKSQSPKGGRIINNGSISAHVPRPFSAPYTATKHAITGLTKSLSLDGRDHNIAVSQIDIGNAKTEMASHFATGVPQSSGDIKPEPTFDVEHCGDAVAYMANLPLDTNIQFMTLMATRMPYIGRG